MDDCLKGSKNLFAGLSFLFLNIHVSCRPGKQGSSVLLHELVGACLGALSLSLLPACWPQGFLLWVKTLCVLQEGVHGWLVDNEVAFSGAAKLRLLRDRVELRALAVGQLVRRP